MSQQAALPLGRAVNLSFSRPGARRTSVAWAPAAQCGIDARPARAAAVVALTLLVALLAGCGGGGGSAPATSPPDTAGGGAPPQVIFVASPLGTGNACTQVQPCTLDTAKAMVQQRTAAMTSDLTISLLNGTYVLQSPLTFGGNDSGANGHRVIYAAAAGAMPVISGGLRVQNWTRSAHAGIYQASVPTGLDTRQLYVNGVRAQRARLLLQDAEGLAPGVVATASGYQYNGVDISSWGNQRNIEIVARVQWKMFRCPVDSIAASSLGQIISVQKICWTNANLRPESQPLMRQGLNWIENSLEALTQPGQWYLDKSKNILYYYPRSGEDMGAATVVVPRLEQLMTGAGAHDLIFDGLIFAYSTWLQPNSANGYVELQAGMHLVDADGRLEGIAAAINFAGSRNISFTGGKFLHLGATALGFNTGSRNLLVRGNTFYDLSGGAVQIGDIDAVSVPLTGGVNISDNFISKVSLEYESTVPLIAYYADNVTIDHNEVGYSGYSGISIGWGWVTTPSGASRNLVTQNHIHDVMQTLIDGGGIYTLGSQPGSEVSKNFIENVGAAGCPASDHGRLQIFGIYHDQGSRYFNDQQNVVRKSCGFWLMLTGAWDDSINNAADVLMDGNYVDANIYFCNRIVGSNMSTPECIYNGNRVSNTMLLGDVPSAAAASVMQTAGVTPAYASARTVPTGGLH